MIASEEFIRRLPKAELHIHIEGSFEPDLMFEIAERNGGRIPFDSVEEVRRSYDFQDLQSFLDIYYQGMGVLLRERDFYDLTIAYLRRAHADGVVHAEIFFDPQGHTHRGVAFETVLEGIWAALCDGEREFAMTSRLIMCFLRHLDEEDAHHTLDQALAHRDRIAGVGLDSSEVDHPPRKFERVFRRAREAGFVAVAHAGEEAPPTYVRQALDLLGVARIDHGNRALEDSALVERLAAEQIPLTVCPLSNVKLRLFDTMEHHPLKQLMDRGLCVSVHSDDPAYFGGYITDNLSAAQQALGLDAGELRTLARNGFEASFLDTDSKERFIQMVDGVAPPEVRPGGQETL